LENQKFRPLDTGGNFDAWLRRAGTLNSGSTAWRFLDMITNPA